MKICSLCPTPVPFTISPPDSFRLAVFYQMNWACHPADVLPNWSLMVPLEIRKNFSHFVTALRRSCISRDFKSNFMDTYLQSLKALAEFSKYCSFDLHVTVKGKNCSELLCVLCLFSNFQPFNGKIPFICLFILTIFQILKYTFKLKIGHRALFFSTEQKTTVHYKLQY